MNLLASSNPDLPAWLRLAAANSSPAMAFASQVRPVSSEPVGLLGLIQGLSNSGLPTLLSGAGVDQVNGADARAATPQRANEDLARLRYVSGLADMMRGGASTGTLQDNRNKIGYNNRDCIDAYLACLGARNESPFLKRGACKDALD